MKKRIVSLIALFAGFASFGYTQEKPHLFVDVVAKALEKGRPDILLRTLPESYRGDIKGLITGVATHLDPDVHQSVVRLVHNLDQVLRDKKDMLLSLDDIKKVPMSAELKGEYDRISAVVQQLTKSDLMDLDRLKQANLEQFLATEGVQILGLLNRVSDLKIPGFAAQFNMIKQSRAKTLSVKGRRAEIEITDGKGGVIKEQMTKVEDRWVPTGLADDWDDMIESVRDSLTALSFQGEEGAAAKQQVLQGIGMANLVIQGIGAAQTPEELKASVAPILNGVLNARNQARAAAMLNLGRQFHLVAFSQALEGKGIGFGKAGQFKSATEYLQKLLKDEPGLLKEALAKGAGSAPFSLVEGASEDDNSMVPVFISPHLKSGQSG